MMLLNVHPPTASSIQRFAPLRNCLPRPKGSSYVSANVVRLGISLIERAYSAPTLYVSWAPLLPVSSGFKVLLAPHRLSQFEAQVKAPRTVRPCENSFWTLTFSALKLETPSLTESVIVV